MTAGEKILTIVIPVFNRANCVCETLDSIAAQDTRDFALILVDNNSSDQTLEVLRNWAESHPDIPVEVIVEKRPNASAARNAGLERVKTEWTLFFDSDDLMENHHISRVVRNICSNPEIDLWGWDTIQEYRKTSKGKFPAKPTHWSNLLNGNFATQRYIARTSLFREVGGWDSEITLWDDIELGTRILEARPRIRKIDYFGQPLSVRVRRSEISISGTDWTNQLSRIEKAMLPISLTLGPSRSFLADIKRAHAYGCAARENRYLAEPYMNALLKQQSSLRNRILLRFLYSTTRLGIRGTHHLLRICMEGRLK